MLREPLVRALGFGEAAADVERHRGLDEVPRVGVAARHPRDVAVGLLHRRDRVDGLRDLVGRDDAGDLGERDVQPRLRFPHFDADGGTFSP